MASFFSKLFVSNESRGKTTLSTTEYRPYLDLFKVDFPERTWPARRIEQPPIWCSVDLRDGNQALKNPMSLQQKVEMWNLLIALGFKEIEIGFPSAATVEYEFARNLIDNNLIPGDVLPQVLVQSRKHLIDKTFESLQGARKAVIHIYNSTSVLQRRVVFGKEKKEIVEIITAGVERVKELASRVDMDVCLEYSPESFTGTELDFALEICEKVCEIWKPTPQNKMILNLPATVEMATPNVYADQIEWFCRHLSCRDSVIISIHPHNDRGTGVAAAELALMAGADRIEGTLFGNGERTGNVDIVTLALNMFSQGVDPCLDFSDINKVKNVYESCTGMTVHPRHPYGGELVFTAFSGSHQDAIRKGMLARREGQSPVWDVPYLPINPDDIGRNYEPIIRINSQSGKGGVAFIMESNFGFDLPKKMHPEFSAIVQKISDASGVEVEPEEIWKAFSQSYLEIDTPYSFKGFSYSQSEDESVGCHLRIGINGKEKELNGRGNGPIDACAAALYSDGVGKFRLLDFYEHALSSGADAEAACYIQIGDSDGFTVWGVGRDSNTTKASVKALLCALNRLKL